MKELIAAAALALALITLFACEKPDNGSDAGKTSASQSDLSGSGETSAALSGLSGSGETSAAQTDTANTSETSAAGEFGTFSTYDTDGNTVTGDILTGHKLTMINIWATTCPYCIDEMPDLVKLNDDYADKGFQIVGIISNVAAPNGAMDKKDAETVKSIIGAAGADYVNLLVTDDISALFLPGVDAVPTTIFLDGSGNKIGKTYLGARSYDIWAKVIESLLQEAG